MKSQLVFELRTLPWRTLAFLLAVIVVVLSLGVRTFTSYGEGYGYGGDSHDMVYATYQKRALTNFYVNEAKDVSGFARDSVREGDMKDMAGYRRDVAFYARVAELMASGRNRQLNRMFLATLERDSGLISRNGAFLMNFSAEEDATNGKESIAVLRHWNRVAPDRLVQVTARTAALNTVTAVFNPPSRPERRAPTLITYALLAVAAAAFVLSFFRDAPSRPLALMRVAPLGAGTQALARWTATLLALAGMLVFAVTVVTLALAASPAHDFGVWRFPMLFPHGDNRAVVELWRVLLMILGYYLLWFALIGSAAFLIRQAARDQSVAMFVIGVGVFADYLNLLKLVPAWLAARLPAAYLNLGQILNHQGPFVGTHVWETYLVLGGWTLGLWLVGATLQALRQRYRVPLLVQG
ncbi:hypothetical protein [Lacticaseibacillus kribbianus]|uniref:hypothetical protein n=1 Tax=Lacticaseibacillus kribbianus TaxID=2926292 RepID=UPI001CD3CAC0|nr:hypothetical protein [Lacticaseibacillus kribbianus]